jgi:predicted nuclease with TOPRIM domain
MTQAIMTEIGSGELIDKITILEIKSERIADEGKLKNIRHELSVLSATRDAHLGDVDGLDKLAEQLKEINEALWVIEDDIRACEAEKDFGQKFIDLARAVYITNDKRAAVKKEINLLTGATIIEEKSYTEFD